MAISRSSNWMAVGAVICLLVGGCAPPDSKSDASATGQASATRKADGESLTLAVIPKSTGGEFWETVQQGAQDAANDLGIKIMWDGPHAETELAEQNKIIENMVNLGVSGMALAPLNNRAMRKPVENVVAAGIPVVIFDSSIDGDAHVSYVATDNEAGGRLGANHLVKRLGEKDRVFLLRYIQGTASTEQRAEGFIKAIEEAGKQVIAQPYSEDATVSGAIKTATNTLERYISNGKLEVDGAFATNLYSTMGLLAALDDLRKSGIEIDLVFIGFDTSPKLIEELNAGRIDALVSQNPHRIGYVAVETLTKHLRGQPIEPLVDTGVELITAERLREEPKLRKLVGLE